MSTRTEDRLTAALAARAVQVQAADLRPWEVPAPPRPRRRAAWAGLAAAACAAAVLAPFVVHAVGGSGGPDRPAPLGGPTPSPTARVSHPQPLVTRTGSADVDGDGRPDRVTLRVRRHPRPYDDVHASVTLAAGGGGDTVLAAALPLPHVLGGRDLDGDGREEVVLVGETGDAVVPQVLSWQDGRLEQLAFAQGSPPLFSGVEADGRAVRYVFDGSGRLYSFASLAPVGRQTRIRVDAWRWTVVSRRGPLLAAVPMPGTLCADLTRDQPPSAC